MEAVTGQSGAGRSGPRRRQGVSPSFNRPRRRANGWTRYRAVVSRRRLSRSEARDGASGNRARAALTQACAIDGSSAPANSSKASLSGLHTTLTSAIPAKSAITRYHSGIWGSDPSRLGAGSYRD